MRAGSSLWSGCSVRGGFGTGSAAQPPCSTGHRHFRGDPVPAHTPDFSGPARYPKNCLWEPCGRHMHTQGKQPRGLSVRRPSPGPSPHQESRSQICEAKKALKEAAWAASLLPGSSVETSPRSAGPGPPGQVGFPCGLPGGGEVLPSGRASQPQLWCVFAQMHAYPMYLALA